MQEWLIFSPDNKNLPLSSNFSIMKFLMLLCSFCIFATFSKAQNYNGTWEGRLQIASSLRIAFIFSSNPDGSLKASWQSPDQTKAILPTDTCYIKADSIFTFSKKFRIAFRGKLAGDSTINGVFTQGADLGLVLKKVEKVSELKRPQTPKPPYPYISKSVYFNNADKSIRYAGTITYPKMDSGKNYFREPVYPSIILISGSGPQDRDETLFAHKPFAVLADFMTRKGFAVLRVDDRGIGETTGKFATATSADFANDVEAAIEYLKQQPQTDTAHISLMGHSEGGMIAPLVATRRNDIHSIVLLAGPGIPIINLMEEQIQAVAFSAKSDSAETLAGKELFTISAGELLKYTDSNKIKINAFKAIEKWAKSKDEKLLAAMGMRTKEQREAAIAVQLRAMNNEWYRYFLGFDPQQYLKKLKCNVLALNGGNDIQVLPTSNLAGIRFSLKKSKSPYYEVKELPGLNHLFQTCKTCTVGEYAELEESFSPVALEIIGNWLMQYGR